MKREVFIRTLKKVARDRSAEIEIRKDRGKGSHWMVRYNEKWTTVPKEIPKPLLKAILKVWGLDQGSFP